MYFFGRIWKVIINFSFSAILLITFGVILSAAWLFRLLEPATFPSYFDSLWYTMVTSTTVGYGDYYPTSIAGRIFAMVFFLYGIMTLTVFIGKIQQMLSDYKRLKEEGKLDYKRDGHVIFIGYGKKTAIAIKEVKSSNAKMPIVLIDSKLDKNPYNEDYVFFINGNPAEDETLLKANLPVADRVFIFSDEAIENDLAADGTTALIALGVEDLSNEYSVNMHTTVEIRKASHKPRFKHANVERFVYSYESVGLLIARECLHSGSATLLNDLLSNDRGSDWHQIKAKKEWKTYKDAAEGVFSSGATLIAVNDDLDVATKAKKTLPIDATLTIVCSETTIINFK
ncbi:ion channel [Niallia taxi]|uniref:ion channel n=1 Tax=Niallia taxi TaxID=2499688 RepID=UPI00293425AF|nr:ion channel [Niallia taxi]WOD61717.1 ion channel [Niallia taxi]